MDWGIDNVKDLLEVASFLATIIGGIAILAAVRSYSISRKQLNFAALESCIKRYRNNFLDLDRHSPQTQVIRYIDLVNEELFYFEHHYLPLDVAEEWIDGMIQFLPIFDPKGTLLNPDHCIPIIAEAGILDQYRFKRVKQAFTVNIDFSLTDIYGDEEKGIKVQPNEEAREKLIKAIVANLIPKPVFSFGLMKK